MSDIRAVARQAARDTSPTRLGFISELDSCTLADAVGVALIDALSTAITAQFTLALNTGTAMDALVLVGTAFRELLADLSPASPEQT